MDVTTNISPGEYIRSRMLDQLRAAETAAAADQFGEAERLLKEARQTANTFPDLKTEVETKAKEIERQRRSRLDALLAEAQALLADADRFDEGRIGRLLDIATEVDPNNPIARRLRAELPEQARQRAEQRLYDETRARCKAMWEQERQMVAASVPTSEILEQCFNRAFLLAQQAAESHPQSALLKGLLNEAQREYNQARARYEAKSTADATGDYKSLLANLQRETDPNKVIPWRDATGVEHPITVGEALAQTRELAEGFAFRKASEYLEQAIQHIAAHAPRAAKTVLLKGHDLFMLDQETERRLEVYRQQTVEPELVQLEKAESLLQQARVAGRADQAWGLVEQAVDAYAWLSEIADVRRALLPRLAGQAEKSLLKAKQALEKDHLDEAGPAAAEARQLAEWVEQYATTFQMTDLQAQATPLLQQATITFNRYQEEERLAQTMNEAATTIRGLLRANPGEAVRRWQELVAEYGDQTVGRRLRQLRREVETHSGISTLLARLDSAFASNHREQIEGALEDARAALQKPENSDFKNQLVSAQEKLQGRLAYLTGLKLLHDDHDAAEALKFFEAVAVRAAHPDSSAAKTEADAIKKNQALEKSVEAALATAAGHMNASPPKPRLAYEVLVAYQSAASLRKKDIQTQLAQARQTWEEKLVEDTQKELARTPPRPARLRNLADEINQELPEPRPIQVAELALAVAAAAEAQQHAQAKEWEQAAAKWKEALAHDGLNPDYKLNGQQARKRAAGIKLEQIEGDEEARGFFNDLEKEIPLDPEIRLWRANFYVRRAQKPSTPVTHQLRYYAAAREAVTVAQEALAHPDVVVNDALRGRARDLDQLVAKAERITREKADIERKLQAQRGLKEFVKARQEAVKLLENNPNDVALTDWWTHARDQAIQTLADEASALTGDNDVWQRFDRQSKILVLNSDHPTAQSLLKELPVLATRSGQQMDSTLRDRDGLLVETTQNLAVLDAQEKRVTEIMDQARAVYDMLQSFKEQINDPTVNSLAAILRQNLDALQSFQNELAAFRQLKARAQSFLDSARTGGDWRNFDVVLNQIRELGFSSHRTTQALVAERDRVQVRRERLLQQREKLLQAVGREQFSEAQRIIQVWENDLEMGDPNDEFGLRAALEVPDPNGKEAIRNWRLLKNWLQARHNQVEKVVIWLAHSGSAGILPTSDVILVPPDAPRDVVQWATIAQEIKALVDKGRFDEANRLGQEALMGNTDWYDETGKLLALQPAVQRLSNPPLVAEQALSQRVRALLSLGEERHEQLQPHVAQAQQQLAWVGQQRYAWDNAFAELTQAFRELEQAHRSLLPWRRNRERIEQARQRVFQAILVCKGIAPQHPSLEGQEAHPLLNGTDRR